MPATRRTRERGLIDQRSATIQVCFLQLLQVCLLCGAISKVFGNAMIGGGLATLYGCRCKELQ
jgi:hypothetical protein